MSPNRGYDIKNILDSTEKVALVTGSASGMGLATALAFAEAGASVVLAGCYCGSVLSAS